MRTSAHRLVIGRRQALAVVAYVGVVIALLAISLLLVADLRDKAAQIAAAQMRLDQLSERSPPGLSASIASNAGVSGSPFLDGRTITVAGAALQQRVEDGGCESERRANVFASRTRRPRRQERFRRSNRQLGGQSARRAGNPLRHRGRNAILVRGQAFDPVARGFRRTRERADANDDRGRWTMAVIRMMRLLRILSATFFAAAAATAAAGPIDEPAGHPPKVQRAPATEGTGVANAAAGPSGEPRPSDPSERPRAGNPLWTVPLDTLSATRDRPLFSASRRPPIVAVPIAAPPPKQEALAPPPPERPLLTLVGTILSPKATIAMLQGSNTETILRLRVGQENDGWLVRGISLRSIVVEKGAQSVELGLPKSNGAPAE